MHFSPEQLDDALKFVNEKYKIEGGHFEIAREKYHADTLKCFKEVFFVDEPTCKSLHKNVEADDNMAVMVQTPDDKFDDERALLYQLEWRMEVEAFITEAIKQNQSLIAVDDKTGEVMGIRLSSLTKKDDIIDPSIFTDEKARKLFTFMEFTNAKSDFYNRYGVTEAVEFLALAVYPKYRQRGLGRKLMAAAVDLLRHSKPENVYIKSAATSNYSAIIFEKVGFEKMWEIEYKDYIVDGEVILNNTGVHKKVITYAIKV